VAFALSIAEIIYRVMHAGALRAVQIKDYLEATGVPRGALVYMASGIVQCVTACVGV
jgi:hypothetical protein